MEWINTYRCDVLFVWVEVVIKDYVNMQDTRVKGLNSCLILCSITIGIFDELFSGGKRNSATGAMAV